MNAKVNAFNKKMKENYIHIDKELKVWYYEDSNPDDITVVKLGEVVDDEIVFEERLSKEAMEILKRAWND